MLLDTGNATAGPVPNVDENVRGLFPPENVEKPGLSVVNFGQLSELREGGARTPVRLDIQPDSREILLGRVMNGFLRIFTVRRGICYR